MRTTTAKTLSLAAISLLLLTGCQGKEELPAIPDPTTASTTASTSAEATETTEATGEATGSAEATAEATASETQNYSGGSKAPEGEYRPADEFGPAQNVPKPVEPEGMNVESEEGLYKFLGYWNDAVNYGIQTGDFSLAEKIVNPEYTQEIDTYIWIGELYNRGGWVIGGRRDLTLGENLLFSHGDGNYSWVGNLKIEDSQPFLEKPGEISRSPFSPSEDLQYDVKYDEGKWEVQQIKFLEVVGK